LDSELFLYNWRREPAGAIRKVTVLHSGCLSKGPLFLCCYCTGSRQAVISSCWVQ